MALPQRPTPTLTEYGQSLDAQLAEMCATMSNEQEKEDVKRDEVHKAVRALQRPLTRAQQGLRNGDFEAATGALESVWTTLAATPAELMPSKPSRNNQLSSVLEDIVWCQGYLGEPGRDHTPRSPPAPLAPHSTRRACHHSPDFFQNGRLITMASLSERVDVFDDAEYLGGVIQLAQELGNYAVGQAISKDTASIQLCRDLVEALSGVLIAFDFRNGPLRRKYDSVKYAIKRLEDLLYEQSLLADAPPAKRARIEQADGRASTAAADGADAEGGEAKTEAEPTGMVDAAEFDAIRQRMEDFDAAREKVRKKIPPRRTMASQIKSPHCDTTFPPFSTATQLQTSTPPHFHTPSPLERHHTISPLHSQGD